MRKRLRHDRGFSLIELLAVMATFIVIAAIAVPQFQELSASMRLGQATREVERELQTARLKAVSTNRRLRVRLNCPTAGSYRIVELLGSAADNGSSRCAYSAYPYPAADNNPLTLPNLDGPIRTMHSEVTVTTMTVEFRPDGTAWTVDTAGTVQLIPPAGTSLTVTRQSKAKVINVNALGKILVQ